MIQTIYRHMAAQFKLPMENTQQRRKNPVRDISASQFVANKEQHLPLSGHENGSCNEKVSDDDWQRIATVDYLRFEETKSE